MPDLPEWTIEGRIQRLENLVAILQANYLRWHALENIRLAKEAGITPELQQKLVDYANSVLERMISFQL